MCDCLVLSNFIMDLGLKIFYYLVVFNLLVSHNFFFYFLGLEYKGFDIILRFCGDQNG